jgi:branched-chain amino acid transport system permease protein
MATTTINSRDTFRQWLFQPSVAGPLALLYVVVATILLVSQDRSSLWFPLANICLVPLFLLSPIVVISAPLPSRVKLSAILLMLVVVMPLVGIYNTSYLELAIQISIFAGLALGLNIVVGFAGLLDLGYVAFFAVGAYLWGSFTSSADTVFNINGWLVPGWAFYVFIVIAVIAAGIVGILLGLPVLRLRGDYLAIVTLGFGEMIKLLARNGNDPINFTNGSQGLHNIGKPPLPGFASDFTSSISGALGDITGLPIRMENPTAVSQQLLFYFIAIAILVIVIIVSRRLLDSPIGRAWAAIREDEVAAIAMGVPLVKMKLLAFAMGASFAGAIGVLFAAKQTFIDPDSFELLKSITILAVVIVGGMGNIKGVVLGGIIVTLLNLHTLTNLSLQLTLLKNANFVVPLINFPIRGIPQQLEPSKYQPFVFGLILVLMMLFRPAGMLPSARRKMELQERDLAPEHDPEVVAEAIERGENS